MITIIAVGKKTTYDKYIEDYCKKLRGHFKITWVFINVSNIIDETKNIANKIPDKDFVILLDEIGKEIDNSTLSKKIIDNKNITFIIGGPYGVNEEIINRANFIWSLGKLIYPYELVRLILTEQIYRSHMVSINHPYHHDN
ncbi:MAG: 23S rRNA (pseudouridine(1915)-N(3))-methyltransferase RlmH [Mycoplasmataceae bacterium]|nr:23S rRNA (pseudouridine(1915)-N(3))-methyltransferase RlmH [Mycoplasmataceae bacterium]